MEPINGGISKDLIKYVKKENPESAEPNEELKGVLKKILNSQIQVSIEGKGHVLNIEPYWCELYFKTDNGLDDPFCDEDNNKNHNDLVYFWHFFYNKDSKSHRNRMDICLGDKNNQVSILLKRAKVTKGKCYSQAIIEPNKQDKFSFSSDYFIAKAILTVLEEGESIETDSPKFDKITYMLLPHQHINEDDITFAQRIRLPKGKDGSGLWFNKKYAFYDASKYSPKDI